MKVKTSELSGAALDWAVAKATGYDVVISSKKGIWKGALLTAPLVKYSPSTDWNQCGPLLKEHYVNIKVRRSGEWAANVETEMMFYIGYTPQIAICRAVVASLLGDEIELPEGLANGLD